MKYFLLTVISLVCVAVPALAQQQGGLPALQVQVDSLQAQNATLQQQFNNLQNSFLGLQKQVDGLSLTADDGTAQALVGIWTGSVSSLEFRRAVTSPSPGAPLLFENFFNLYPAGPGGQPAGPAFGFSVVQPQNGLPMTVQVNPEMWLARNDGPLPLTFTITRDGMKLDGTGAASPANNPPVLFNLFGAVLTNNFFFLRLRVPATGNCAVNGVMIVQGIGSLNPVTRSGMTFTGSAVEGDCRHMVFRVGLSKQL